MKNSRLWSTVCVLALMALFGWSRPVLADDANVANTFKQAEDLVHQAWGPGADTPPTNDQRVQLLTKASEMVKSAPKTRVHGHRMQAMKLIEAALTELRNGDPNKKVDGILKDADSEMRETISETE